MHFSKILPTALLSATLLGGLVSIAQASTFTVTKTVDSSDGVCDVDCSLRDAIIASNAAEGSDTIEFASDIFASSRTVSLTGGELRITDSVSINGPDDAKLTVDAHGNSRVFEVLGGTVSLDDLIITGGNGTRDGSGAASAGGSIYSSGSTLSLERCAVVYNGAPLGGGIFMDSGTLNLTNCTIARNGASTGGGGLNIAGGVANLLNCTVASNFASDPLTQEGIGGGILNGGTLSLSNCIVAQNNENPQDSFHALTDYQDIYSTDEATSGVTSLGHNLVGYSNRDADFLQSDLIGVDPLFQLEYFSDHRPALTTFNSATLTIALRGASPARDAGNSTLQVDQRGKPRPYGSAPDIGAYEGQANATPIIESLSLIPQAPTLHQGINADVIAKDPDGFYVKLTYDWTYTRDGITRKLPLPYSALYPSQYDLKAGDVITVTVIASDTINESEPKSASVTIANTPIVISQLSLRPQNPYTFDQMMVSVTTEDFDKTKPFFSYTWTRDGVVIKTVNNSRSNQNFFDLKAPGHGDKGDVIEVTVTATDGPTTATAKASATIRNSVPVLSSLTLTPQAPTPTKVVTATFGNRDADGDQLARIYKWKIGKKVLVEEKSMRLNLAKYPFVKAGDVVSLEMRLSDGESLSKTRIAQVTVVAPTPPATVNAPLTSGETSGNAS